MQGKEISDSAVEYIKLQIEDNKKKEVLLKDNIHSIELEIKAISDKMKRIDDSRDKIESLFLSAGNENYDAEQYNILSDRMNKLKEEKNKRTIQYKKINDKIKEMEAVIAKEIEENKEKEKDSNENDYDVLWILEADRKRISRDIHDTVVQNLTALIHKQEFIIQLANKDINRAKTEMNNAKMIVKDSIKDLRDIIYQLRPMELDDLGFNEALLNLIDKLDDNYKDIIIHASIDCTDDIPQIISISCLRIINELASNSYKYANCSNIYIDVNSNDEYINIDYRDDGCGFDYNSVGKIKENNSGYGIRMLNERISLLKGSIDYNRDKAEFVIKIPLEK